MRKNRILVFVVSLIWSCSGFTQMDLAKTIDQDELVNYWKSDSLFNQGEFSAALTYYEKCSPQDYLDVAWPVKKSLCYLLTGDTLGARNYFRKFVYSGGDYMKTSYISQIPLLESLVVDKSILDKFYLNTALIENSDETCLYPDVQQFLLEMRNVDQQYRSGNGNSSISLTEIDSINRMKLDSLISIYGWLGYSEVGNSGENAAFLIVQHADRDLEFQKKVLKLMQVELYHNNILPQSFVMLYDRVMVNSNESQLFGSQVELNEDETEYICKSLYSKQFVNQYRLYFGLATIESYLEMMNKRLN